MNVLISAYACEPGKGSEQGTGWNWAVQSARFNDTWVLTRANNRETIESAEAAASLHWVYFDLPAWARAFKRGRRGARLYYHLWQAGAWVVARRLHRRVGFDLAHHASFATHWMPTFLPLLDVPVVIGPVGGGETAPAAFDTCFGWRGFVLQRARRVLRHLDLYNPLLRTTLSRCTLALAITPDTAAALGRLGATHVKVMYPPVGLTQEELARLAPNEPSPAAGRLRCISIGRLVHWKGFELGLLAFAQLKGQVPDTEYVILGSGPERERLQRTAERLGIAEAVNFAGRVSRDEELAMLGDSDVLVHPSLGDPGAWVCVEAMGAGKPVACVGGGGPEALVGDAGVVIRAGTPDQLVGDLAAALVGLAQDPAARTEIGARARARAGEVLLWDRQGEVMSELYRSIAKGPSSPAERGPSRAPS